MHTKYVYGKYIVHTYAGVWDNCTSVYGMYLWTIMYMCSMQIR